MIIELSEKFADIEPEEWNNYHVAFENIINAHRMGWHIFAPPRKVANRISKDCDLSRSQKSIFDSHVQDRITTLLGQARSADHTIICIPDSMPVIAERSNQFALPISKFIDPRNLLPFLLITENAQNDGVFLERLCLIFSKHLGYQSPMMLEHRHGGGGTTAAQYREALTDYRPTLCVIDSDRRYPDGPLGSTARAVRGVELHNTTRVVQAHILPVREAENLVPLSFLFDVYGTNPNISDTISKIHKYKNSDVAKCSIYNVLYFIDFKTGDTKGSIAKIPMPYKTHMLNFCSFIGTRKENDDQFSNPECDEKAVPGISENLIHQTISFINNNGRLESSLMRKILSAPFWDELEHILRLILAFSCGGQRLPV